ncbi:hypothetical protein BC940DRAFT_336105 [Gongronella butleri]|nr:hypothetical protein BC940DRAFT_336105 [Gongronella butleri]
MDDRKKLDAGQGDAYGAPSSFLSGDASRGMPKRPGDRLDGLGTRAPGGEEQQWGSHQPQGRSVSYGPTGKRPKIKETRPFSPDARPPPPFHEQVSSSRSATVLGSSNMRHHHQNSSFQTLSRPVSTSPPPPRAQSSMARPSSVPPLPPSMSQASNSQRATPEPVDHLQFQLDFLKGESSSILVQLASLRATYQSYVSQTTPMALGAAAGAPTRPPSASRATSSRNESQLEADVHKEMLSGYDDLVNQTRILERKIQELEHDLAQHNAAQRQS